MRPSVWLLLSFLLCFFHSSIWAMRQEGRAWEAGSALPNDALGHVTSIIQPGGRTIETAYDLNATGLETTLTEPSGQETVVQQDALGRVLTRSDDDGTTSYTYDANGNVLTLTQGSDVITRTYEATRDLVSTYTNAASETIGYTYDKNGNLSSLTYPGGKVVQYRYDSKDRLVRLSDWAGRVTIFEYDASDRLTAIKRPNGTIRRMTYDLAGQLTSFSELAPNGSMIAYQGWRYDAGGRPTQRLRVPGATAFSSPAFSATYHDDNRLASLTPQGGSPATVTSDLDGNLLSASLWEPTRAWAPAGFTWDARNRLTGVTSSGVSYAYDAEGHLISRTQGSNTTRYTVNPVSLSQVLITHHADGSKTYHVYGAGLLYEERFDASEVSQGTRTYHYDQVGSTLALTNDAAAVTGRLEYTAYGLTSHSSGVVDTEFRYNGQYGVMTDLSTGILHMRARWYSPSLGRFLNEDPIGFSGGMNWYAYADGNPINLMDPFGLAAVGGIPAAYGGNAWATAGGYAMDVGLGVYQGLARFGDMVNPFGNPAKSAGVYDDHLSGKAFAQVGAVGTYAVGGAVAATKLAVQAPRLYTTLVAAADETGMVVAGGGGIVATKAALSNAQLVQKAATKAEKAIGGTGRFAGTEKHKYATKLLERYQQIHGYKGLDFNVHFDNGAGNRGFLDVLDRTNGIIYDWKFGYPSMSPAQLNTTPQMSKYQRNFGLPTQVIKP